MARDTNQEDRMSKLYVYAGIAASVIMIAIGIGAIAIGLSGRSEVRGQDRGGADHGHARYEPGRHPRRRRGGGDRDGRPGLHRRGRACRRRIEREMLRRVHAHPRARGHGRPDLRGDAALHRQGRQSPRRRSRTPQWTRRQASRSSNPQRNIWVTETALGTALNTSYFAEQVAEFSIVMGLCLLLAGIGFLVLTLRLPWRQG